MSHAGWGDRSYKWVFGGFGPKINDILFLTYRSETKTEMNQCISHVSYSSGFGLICRPKPMSGG